MNRLLIATSVFALALGSAAMAQNSSSGMSQTPMNSTAGSGIDNRGNASPHGTQSTTSSGGSVGVGSPGTQNSGSSNMNSGGMNSSSMNSGSMRANSGSSMSSSQIRHAQTELKQQGLYRGTVDGKNGPKTRAAISQFQKRKGLPQSASLDQQTLDDLSGGGSGSSMGGSSGSSMGGSSGSSMHSNSPMNSTSTPSASPGNATTQGGAGSGNSMQPGFKQPANNGAQTR